jgi:cytochrome c553
MRKSTFMASSWLMLTVLILQPQAVFADDAAEKIRADIANGQTIFNEGRGEAPACQSCHGKKALGNDAMGTPRLANIGLSYILKQLIDFATDKRFASGTGGTMNDISKALNEQDRRDVAVYLDSLEYEVEPSDLKSLAPEGGKPANLKEGEIIVTKGIKRLVPACQNCHGFGGRARNVPAIHRQKFVYLVNQLNGFRNGSRANDPTVYNVGIMRRIAKKLTDENIADIAAFLSTASGTAP